MIIVDAHQDIAYNAFTYGRDYRTSALVKRIQELSQENPWATIGLPESLVGRIAVVFSTLFVAPEEAKSPSLNLNEATYSTPKEAYTLAMKQLDHYHELADGTDKIRIVTSNKDLDHVLESWGDNTDVRDHIQGFVIAMEGADPILEPKQFDEWYERGVRSVGLSWSTTRYAAGNGKEGGLSKLGYELLDVMADYGVLLDISHLSERAAHEALDHYGGTIIASHSNPRKFCDRDRHLSDDLIKKLAEHDGVMGVVLYNRFLDNDWKTSDGKSSLTIQRVGEVIDHICQVTGSARHVGIGSDLDGGFGAQSIPYELDTAADMLQIAFELMRRKYEAEDIENIMGGNMLRQLRAVLD